MKLIWEEAYDGRFEVHVGAFKCVAETSLSGSYWSWRVFAGGGDYPIAKGDDRYSLEDCDHQCHAVLVEQFLRLQAVLIK